VEVMNVLSSLSRRRVDVMFAAGGNCMLSCCN